MENQIFAGTGIQRTMRLLSESTQEKRNKVRIAIYGQSLSKQAWSIEFSNYLQKRFPYTYIDIRNLSVGGFAAEMLIKSAEFDIYPFYPDLIIIHVFGGEPAYEELIRNFRTRTTAEVILQSDPVTWLPSENEPDKDRLRGHLWHDQHSMEWLPSIARKYGCEMAEIRQPWYRYLKENNLTPSDLLLPDMAHFNDQGNHLFTELLEKCFVSLPESKETVSGAVSEFTIGNDAVWADQNLSLTFEGNRVDLELDILNGGIPESIEILIDGKKPSEFNECHIFSRPNGIEGKDWPWQVGAMYALESRAPIIEEQWTVEVTRINEDYSQCEFEIYGSVTGNDGTGISTEDFVSTSGRIFISKDSWHLQRAKQITKLSLQVPYKISWNVIPLCKDTLTSLDVARGQCITLVQGIQNTCHTLELRYRGALSPMGKIRIYCPLKDIRTEEKCD